MTGTPPYEPQLDGNASQGLLLEALLEVLEKRRRIGGALVLWAEFDPEAISPRMRELRGSDLEARKSAYLNQRVLNQIDWYKTKARWNKRWADRLSNIVIVSQFVALLFSIARMAAAGAGPNAFISSIMRYNLAGLLASIATACIAWLQLRRHEELAQAYATAGHELALLVRKLKEAGDEQGLAAFVTGAETVMSSEHGVWMARRTA